MGRPVDFAVVGVQKAGTTALHDLLAPHPELARSVRKELHVFDQTADAAPAIDTLFEGGDERLRGDFTPSYIFHPHAIPRLLAHNPDVKLVVMLRDPVDRAFSHWRMQKVRGIEPLGFSEAIRAGRERVSMDQPYERAFFRHSYVERGFYGAQIARLYDHIARDRVLILQSEFLKREQQACIASLCGFLGIGVHRASGSGELHFSFADQTHDTLSHEDRHYLRKLFAEDQDLLKRLTGLSFDET
jgi:hypothetical protein